MRRPLLWPRVCFLLAAGLFGAYQTTYSLQVVRNALTATTTARVPLRTGWNGVVAATGAAAARAGVAAGDTVESINGRPFTGARLLEESVRTSRPGASLGLRLRHPDGTRTEARVILVARRERPLPASAFFLILLNLGVPALCVAIGFTAVYLQDRNPLSWLLLALTISFSQLIVEPGWDGPFRTGAFAFRALAEKTLGVWILLFAIQFSSRNRWDQKAAGCKWLLLGPLSAAALVRAFYESAIQDSFRLVALLSPWAGPIRTAWLTLTAMSVAAALVLLGFRRRGSAEPEEAHRLRLLAGAAILSLGPLFTLIVVSLLRGRAGLEGVPLWISVPALLMLAVFPATVCYLVLVPQALEVRMLLRDALRAALRERGLGWIRFCVVGAAAVLLLMLEAQPGRASADDVRSLALILLAALVLQPALGGLLTRWLDSGPFRAVRQREAALEALATGNWTSRDALELTEAAAEGISAGLRVARISVLLKEQADYVLAVTVPKADREASWAARADVVQAICKNPDPILVYSDGPRSWVSRLPGPERDVLEKLKARLLLPLWHGGTLYGVIGVGPKSPDHGFSQGEVQRLGSLANRLAVALENRRLSSELRSEWSRRERLRAEREAAREANAAKSAFLASMSHELRTPLNAILGYSELLCETAEEAGAQGMVADLNRIHAAGRHLLTLINSVLDISKIEAGRMELHWEHVDVSKLVDDVASIAEPLMEKNRNRFRVSTAPALGTTLADATKLRQVLFNLLSNAAKFTTDGEITLRVEREQDRIHFAVRYTGIGISPEQLAKLFQPFTQASSEIRRKYGGTGLGLVLSRHFCHLMGGDITVTSEPGSGSVFTAILPCADRRPGPDGEAQAGGEQVSPKLCPVLLIDDDPATHDLLGRLLSKHGYRLIGACAGAEGLEKARRLRPSVVLLDVLMQDTDGWRLLAEFKQDPELASIPVIMLTIVDNEPLGISLGASGYLLKPVERSQLLAALSPYRQPDATALVVDDDPACRRPMRSMLESAGFRVLEAANGLEAFRCLHGTAVQVILLDLIMPEMDGFDFLVHLRAKPEWTSLPVVIVTSKDLSRSERLWLEKRAGRVVSKSTPGEILIEEVRRQIETHIHTRGNHHADSVARRGQ